METGSIASVNVDSLSAFFPGLQAMMGDVESCVTHLDNAFMTVQALTLLPGPSNRTACKLLGLSCYDNTELCAQLRDALGTVLRLP